MFFTGFEKDWALIVGEAAARHSQPYRLQHATLFIHTDNPSWSHNFLTMQGKLLAAIGKALPRKKWTPSCFCEGPEDVPWSVGRSSKQGG